MANFCTLEVLLLHIVLLHHDVKRRTMLLLLRKRTQSFDIFILVVLRFFVQQELLRFIAPLLEEFAGRPRHDQFAASLVFRQCGSCV